jgi:iron complex transport system substrate-binding protein
MEPTEQRGVMRLIHRFGLIFFLTPIIWACDADASEERRSNPTEIEVKYATGFTIEKTPEGYRVEVRNPQDTTEILGSYLLSEKGGSEGLPVPMKSFVLNSTTFGAYFDRLEIVDRIDGMTYTDRVMNENLKSEIDAGRIREVISGDGLDFETVLDIDPEAVLAYSFGEADFTKYEEADLPVILIMEYKESHPLARTEWIKVVGCLTGKLDEAVEIFEEVEAAYEKTYFQARLHSTLPSAFTGSKYGDFWYAPGRDSYVAKFIRDAGARYTFDDIEGQANAELDFERAFERISQADYWGMIVSSEEPYTKKDIADMNPLYRELQAYRQDQVFVCNTSVKDYFGDAVMEPHLILLDLYTIFHGRGERTEDDFHYFKPVR